MKKIYTLALFPALVFSLHTSAQCTLNITASTNDTICAGQPTTLTANVVGPLSAVNTTMAAGNNHRGNMFDITAINTVTITSFDASPMAATTIEIYYKTGTWVGFDQNSAAWTLIGSAAVPGVSLPTPVPVPVSVNVTIPAGQTYAFYVTSTNTSVSLNYTDGTGVGNVYASDANIQFREGCGHEYPFASSPFMPRIWNGVIHYSTGGAATYLWNTSATSSSIMENLMASGAYFVEVNVPGCPSTLYDTLNMYTSTPTAIAGSDFGVCAGDNAVLSGAGTGNAPLQYLWDQAVIDNVPFQPSMTQDYVLTVMDAYGCTDTDTINIAYNLLPVVSAGNDAVVCAGSMHTLNGSGAATYVWDNGITDGVPFAVTGTLTYEVIGTDANGCVDNDSVTVTLHTVNVATSVLNETITAADTTASYQWIDCNTMQPIAGETNYWFTATVNGSYAVVITDSLCSDTSACEIILSTQLNAVSESAVSIYPNPNQGTFVLNTGSVAEKIQILSVTGEVIAEFAPVKSTELVSLNGAAGVYFVKVYRQNGEVNTLRIMRQ